MAEIIPPSTRSRPSLLGPLSGLAGVLVGALAGVLLILALAWFWSGVNFLRWLQAPFSSSRTVIDIGQATVVHRIQQLERLETVVYTLEKIVKGERERVLPKFLTGDRLLLIVHGDVVAGVDLGRLRNEDVTVREKRITFRMPKAEVFSTRIDNAKTNVYSRETGLFAPLDPDLETEVRREAERQLREAALNDGILRVAEQNARATLSAMLRGFGFESVEIR